MFTPAFIEAITAQLYGLGNKAAMDSPFVQQPLNLAKRDDIILRHLTTGPNKAFLH